MAAGIAANSDFYDAEGTQYALFRENGIAGHVDDKNKTFLVKDYLDMPLAWWQRSTDTRDGYFLVVDKDGNPSADTANTEDGVVVGFCL